jgi:hypothetical protein
MIRLISLMGLAAVGIGGAEPCPDSGRSRPGRHGKGTLRVCQGQVAMPL